MEGELGRALGRFPVVVLTGARQTGKTTLVGRFPGRLLRSLDDLDLREAAQKRPQSLLVGGTGCTFDEVHLAPGLFPAIKRDVDRDRRPGQGDCPRESPYRGKVFYRLISRSRRARSRSTSSKAGGSS